LRLRGARRFARFFVRRFFRLFATLPTTFLFVALLTLFFLRGLRRLPFASFFTPCLRAAFL